MSTSPTPTPTHGDHAADESKTPVQPDPSLSDLDKLRQLRKDVLAGCNAQIPCPEHLKDQRSFPATRQQEDHSHTSASTGSSDDESAASGSPALAMDLENDNASTSHVSASEPISTAEPQPQEGVSASMAFSTQDREKLNRPSAPVSDQRSTSRSPSLNTERYSLTRRPSREPSQALFEVLGRRGRSSHISPRLERVSRSRSPTRHQKKRRSRSPSKEHRRPCSPRFSNELRDSRSRSPLPGVGPPEPANKAQASSPSGEDSRLPHLTASQLSLQSMPRQQTTAPKDGPFSAVGSKSDRRSVPLLSSAQPAIPLPQKPMLQSLTDTQPRPVGRATAPPKSLPQPRPGNGPLGPAGRGAKAASTPKTTKATPKQNALSKSAPAGALSNLKDRLSETSRHPNPRAQANQPQPASLASRTAPRPADTFHRASKYGQSKQDDPGGQRGRNFQAAAGPSSNRLRDRVESATLLGRIDLVGQPVPPPPSVLSHRSSSMGQSMGASAEARFEASRRPPSNPGVLQSRISETRRYSYDERGSDQSDRGSDAPPRRSEGYQPSASRPPYLDPSSSRPASDYDYRYEPRPPSVDHYSPEGYKVSPVSAISYNHSPGYTAVDHRNEMRSSRPPTRDSYERLRRQNDDYSSYVAAGSRATPPRPSNRCVDTYQPRNFEDQRRPPPQDGPSPSYNRSRPVRPGPYY